MDLLEVERFLDQMSPKTRALLQHVELKTFTDSTNLMALRNIDQWRDGALYVSEFQHAGRGRRGRTWVGPLATNLYFSLMWRFAGGAEALEGLALMVGLAILLVLAAALPWVGRRALVEWLGL